MTGKLAVGVLSAGGTIALAVVRDLAESEEVSHLRVHDRDGKRAGSIAAAQGLGRPEMRHGPACSRSWEQREAARV